MPLKNQINTLLQQARYPEALALCEDVRRGEPKEAETWMILAAAYGRAGKPARAEECAKQAVNLAPENLQARFFHAMTLLEGQRSESAILELKKIIHKEPQHGPAHACLGEAFAALKKHDFALVHLRKAAELLPENAVVRTSLANACEFENKTDEAQALIDEVLQTNPDNPLANIILARLKKRTNQLEPARQILERVLSAPIEDTFAVEANNLLALILDKQERYSDAWTAAVKCKTINGSITSRADGPRPETSFQLTQACRAAHTPANIATWGSAAKDDIRPPLFLIGFPRSGTTLAEQILSTHSMIRTTNEIPIIQKLVGELGTLIGHETPYPFSVNQLEDRHIRQLRSVYTETARSFLGDIANDKIIVDKLPLNILHLGLIHRVFPESPVLIMLRDPRDACLSAFMQLFTANDAMANFNSIDHSARYYDASMGLWLHYRKVLHGLNYLEVRYEDLVTRFTETVKTILAFYKLEWEDDILHYYEHKRHIATPSYQDVSSPIYSQSMQKWIHYREHLEPILPILEPYVREFGYAD